MRYTLKDFKTEYPNDKACLLSVLENRYGNTCPRCGIAAVLPGVTDYVELLKLRHTRFGPMAGVPLPDEET